MYFPAAAWAFGLGDHGQTWPQWNQQMLERLRDELVWDRLKEARSEYFMAADPETLLPVQTTYNYGTPPHDQTYVSKQWHPDVSSIMSILNEEFDSFYNVCFLNRYDDERQALGWHSDDSPGMLHEHPIAVVSFGEARDIWVREKGTKGEISRENRYLLQGGSLSIMPPGLQQTHQHRIPKGSKKMGARISLTFRRYVPMVGT